MSARTKTTADLAYLCRALKAPSLLDAAPRLAERARSDTWSHEEYLAACLEGEVAARQSHGGEARVRAARLPARKTPREVKRCLKRFAARRLFRLLEHSAQAA